ncbi:hypothetical protein LTR81_018976 [Elasticomyces elasticus]
MAQRTHQSVFTYSITKPYPFRWFTPTAIGGFIVLAAIFSLINFVSSGFILINELSSNPNTTQTENRWFASWPSFLTSKAQATCQTLSLPINTQFFTNQTALTYTLTNVWQQKLPDGSGPPAPSLSYTNNVLQDCVVASIQMDLAAMDRSQNQFAYDEWGVTVRSYITCTVHVPNGIMGINLTQTYDYVPADISLDNLYVFLGTGFVGRDNQTRAALWWGESLMSTYWALLTWSMQMIRSNDTAYGVASIRRGTVAFSLNQPSTDDILDPSFFQVDYRFMVDAMDPPGAFAMIYTGLYDDEGTANQVAYLSRMQAYPNIWDLADALAKSVYSTILADLGQVDSNPNVVTNSTALQNLTAVFDDIRIGVTVANAFPGPAEAPFVAQSSTTGPLVLTPSKITAEYLCQIPQRKAVGNLIVGILVADLVFLNAVWQIFRLLVDWLALKSEETQKCATCDGSGIVASARRGAAVDEDADEQHELAPLKGSATVLAASQRSGSSGQDYDEIRYGHAMDAT